MSDPGYTYGSGRTKHVYFGWLAVLMLRDERNSECRHFADSNILIRFLQKPHVSTSRLRLMAAATNAGI